MNRVTRAQRIIWLEQLAAAAEQAAKAEREALADDAGADYIANGTASTWRMPDIGTVSSRIARDAIDVVDQAALTRWVAERHPTEVEQTVRPAYFKALCKTAAPSGDLVVDTGTGEIVPGLRHRPGGRFLGISIAAAPAAVEVFGALAVEALHAAELAAGPAIGVELAALDAGEQPGHLATGEV